MDGQMSIFDFPEYLPGEKHTRFIRKSEYESYHCENCGYKHPLIQLVGDWPCQKRILTEKCPNCNAIVDIPSEIRKENELYNSSVEKAIERHNAEKEKKEQLKVPCNRYCDVEWCSIACFEKRGQIYDKVHREWCKDSEGDPLIRDTKECDWNPKAVPVNIKGICDDGYCPSCGASLDDLIEKCPDCGTLLDWERWKQLNNN